MKKFTGATALLALIGLLLLTVPAVDVSAQQGPPTATPITPTITNTPNTLATALPPGRASQVLLRQEFTMAALGGRNLELVSPQATGNFSFQIPDNWLASGNNVLSLTFEYSVASLAITEGTATPGVLPSAVMRVRLDGQVMATISLNPNSTGARTVQIPLSSDIMGNPSLRTHTLQFALDARSQCLANLDARVRIRADLSTMRFEYRLLAPTIDLALYPRPFFNNPPANQTETVMLVLPATYTDTDLGVAASISAGLGQLTGNRLQIRTTTADQLTAQDRAAFGLILIGQIGQNALLDQLYAANVWPTRLNPDGSLVVGRTAIAPDDGVVQIALHPENPNLAVAAVTGLSPDALRKAAQVLAGPPSLIGLGGQVALVSQIRQVQPANAVSPEAERLTFADLGFINNPIYGVGTQFAEIQFPLPDGIELTEDAALEMLYDYSDTLADLRATVTVFMNETPINSVFVDRSRRFRASIPPSTVRPGETNTLLIQITADTGDLVCDTPSSLVTWFLPRPESTLFLPRRAATSRVPRISLLSEFPLPFSRQPDLSDVYMIIPAKPQAADLDQMSRLWSRLGASARRGARYAPRVSTGSISDSADRAAYHFIVLGRPSTNPLLASLNDRLPQPFVPGTDELQQILDNVTFRLPPGFDIGLIELIQSPWTENRVVLIVSGTGPLGQENAVNVLLGRFGSVNLQGNVVFANQTTIWTINTRTRESLTIAPTATREPTAVPATTEPGAAVTPTGVPVFTVTPTMTLTPTPTQAGW